MIVTLMLSVRILRNHTNASASQDTREKGNDAKISMNVTMTTMEDVFMNVSIYQGIIGAHAMMDLCWHMMDTIAWMWMNVWIIMVDVSKFVSIQWAATNASVKMASFSATTNIRVSIAPTKA